MKRKASGLNYSVRRVTTQIPGLREAYHYVEALKRIERFGLMDIGGVVSVLMLAYTLYRQLTAMIDEQKRQHLCAHGLLGDKSHPVQHQRHSQALAAGVGPVPDAFPQRRSGGE